MILGLIHSRSIKEHKRITILGGKIFLPSIHEILTAVQIDCTDWHYLCSIVI